MVNVAEPDIPLESVTTTRIGPNGSEDETGIVREKVPLPSDVPLPTTTNPPRAVTVTPAFGVRPVAVSVTTIPVVPDGGVSTTTAGVIHVLVF